MSGNKGAVGIRLEYYDTSFCFITAHLAAGHTNIDERNADYQTIVNGLHFLRGKTIESHEYVIWALIVVASAPLNFIPQQRHLASGHQLSNRPRQCFGPRLRRRRRARHVARCRPVKLRHEHRRGLFRLYGGPNFVSANV